MRSYLAKIFVLLLAFSLTACGFKLRGNYLIAPELQTMHVSSADKFGELTRITKQHLVRNQVNILPTYSKEAPELRILKGKLDRRTLSVFPNGQVAEYELIYTVKYQIVMPNKEPQDFTFELYRDYQDDPDIALAKSRELDLMLKEMRIEAADRILRNLASTPV